MEFTHTQATAVGFPISIGGREYVLRPLRDTDYAEFIAYVQQRIAERTLPIIESIKLPQPRAAAHDAMIRTLAAVCWGDTNCAAALTTLEGLARLLWLGMRRDNPTLTPDAIQALIMENPDSLRSMADTFQRINAPPAGMPNEPPGKAQAGQ